MDGGGGRQWRWGKLRSGDLKHERSIKKKKPKKTRNDGRHQENKDPLNQPDVNSQSLRQPAPGPLDLGICRCVNQCVSDSCALSLLFFCCVILQCDSFCLSLLYFILLCLAVIS